MEALQGAPARDPLRPGDRRTRAVQERLADPLRQGPSGRAGSRIRPRARRRALLPPGPRGGLGQHAVERVRQLFAKALDYPLPATTGDYGLNRAQLADAPGGAPYLLFLHGTTWDTKHWPEAYWRDLAERVCEHGWNLRLPWGNPNEKARAERIAEGLENAAVLPRLSLAGMAKVLAGARACVAVDTGLGHLAAALDVPTLSLYGPTNPGFTGAYGRSQVHLGSDFPCAPCLKKTCTYQPTEDDKRRFDLKREQPLCFTRLNPQRVATQLEALLLTEDTH